MRTLHELIDREDPALPVVPGWLVQCRHPLELLEPSESRGDMLVGLQVTTREPLGAIAYETGGILIDSANKKCVH